MRKICLLLVFCLVLSACSAFAEGTAETAALVEQAWVAMEAEDYETAVPLLQKAADLGDATAQRRLGACYGAGLGIQRDEKEAVKYFQLAADQGDIPAKYNLAFCYLEGIGLAQDTGKAEELLLSCADQGDAESQYALGYCYFDGDYLKQDYEKASRYLQLAADQGIDEACYYLGLCYKNGWGVEPDDKKAADYLQRAADQGVTPAQYKLGEMYQLGDGVEQDYDKAFHYYKLAADQDAPEALTAVGYFYGQGLGTEQNLDEMLKYYNRAAEMGEPMAQFNLGCCYRDGTGVKQDYGKMHEYYRLAVEKGNADAQFNLGYVYQVGLGVEPDYSEAYRLYQLSADQGFPVAMFAVGDCYYLGNGVEKDLAAAAEWYRKALNAGYEPDETDRAHMKEVLGTEAPGTDAPGTEAPAAEMTPEELYQAGRAAHDAGDYAKAMEYYRRAADAGSVDGLRSIGNLYANGEGMEPDPGRALEYYDQAAAQGDAKAFFNIGVMYQYGENGESVLKPVMDTENISLMPLGWYESRYMRALLTGKSRRKEDVIREDYAELCFTLDYFFGHPGTAILDRGISEKGLDAALDDVPELASLKDRLKDPDMIEYMLALYDLFNIGLNDGHCSHFGLNTMALPEFPFPEVLKKVGNRAASVLQTRSYFHNEITDAVRKARAAAWGDDVYRECGSTAIIRIDAFKSDNAGWEAYYAGKGEIPMDAVGITWTGLKRASENPSIRNILFDLSANGGGSNDMLSYMIDLMFGDNVFRGYNVLTGQDEYAVLHSDKNLDGVFDEKDDEVKYDFNYAVLTTRASFSCGNLMPVLMQEHGAVLLGEPSGGGTCAIQISTLTNGGEYMMSSWLWALRDAKGESVEGGCKTDLPIARIEPETPTHEDPRLSNGDYAPFFDDVMLDRMINEWFEEKALAPAA